MVAILVAKEAVAAGIETLTFVSAAANFPGVPDRYITSKRYQNSPIILIKAKQRQQSLKLKV
jgi:hypothetical protein